MSCECGCIDIKVVLKDETINVPFEFGDPVEHIVVPDTYTGPMMVIPAEEQQTIQTKDKFLADNVIVGAIPDEYIVPVGTEEITVTKNGTVSRDVANKETVTVNTNVPIPPGYIIPTGDLEITENGQYDVTGKAKAAVNVQPPLEQKSVTPTKQTQTVEPTASNYGLSRVTINPIPDEYIIPSGTQSIVQNGQYDITDKAAVDVQVRQPSGTKQISIIQNGTTTEDVEWVEDAEISVDVPNSYTTSDEGKVVSSGVLVGQTSRNITANGTVDTTLNDEIVVNVPNTYTASDEGKVVNNGALVAQTSRTVSDNGTYDTTLNNEVVVNNEDYADALVVFGVKDDLADGIEAMTTYSNEVTGASDTTLSDAVRTLADGYGGGGGNENNLVDYAGRYSSLFNNRAIPENIDIHAKYVGSFDSMIREAKGIKTLKLAADVPATNFVTFAYHCTSLETVDFSGIVNGTSVNHNGTFWACSSLKTIIGLDLSNASSVNNMFTGCSALENITIKQNTCAISISFVACRKLTNASLVSIANGLAVGSYTLALHATSKSALRTIIGTVSDGAFVEDADGTVTLTDFITNTKGWTIA